MPKIYKCNTCHKKYKHRQSLNNHNKKKHTDPETNTVISNTSIETIACKFCKKEFKHTQSKYRHQKQCKYKTSNTRLYTEDEVNEMVNELFFSFNDFLDRLTYELIKKIVA